MNDYRVVKYVHMRKFDVNQIGQSNYYPWRNVSVTDKPGGISVLMDVKLSNYGGSTLCIIQNLETQEYHFGQVYCSRKDQYVKKIGRELALNYALLAMQENKKIVFSPFADTSEDEEFTEKILDHYSQTYLSKYL